MTRNSAEGGGETGNGLTSAVRARILDTYLDRLADLGNPIAGNPEWLGQAMHQAEAVLTDLARADLGGVRGYDRSHLALDPLSAEIGGERAVAGIHPTESLHAATVLFSTVIDEIVPAGTADPRAVIALSEALHAAIMRRVGVATISYAGFLLKKVHNSHLEERHRMARELHDRAAHAVGVGLQNLELHDIYINDQPERSAAKLEVAKGALREALKTVRALSAELGSAVGADGLVAALGRYLKVSVPPDIDVRFTCSGDDQTVPDTYREEVYLVLREAVRNALLHGDPGRLDVCVDVEARGLHGVVRDDGDGFDVARVRQEDRGVGLTSMRERVALLGGTLTITSAAGRGTTVDIRVQLPEVVR
ncbi:histidine kinase [Actinokineospora auranticolor]|uniref:Histidine kinase/DNA gyrase B/HSP90-like ATPase n=1 Tax=Actinokineospora auranticolor TaxID=155976 RepID=A0A2S6GD14_9PSEU|nr:ATP-binding protein [Actinokineospora auranticolor]PPK63134.1 histidine kinase/DNA gyrase B/HSP90-like ATPase [Actinokineospora auranticolor]